jgi:hypothetical protein
MTVMQLRIVGHGFHVFEYPPAALSEAPPGVRCHGYAKRYRAYRWLPEPSDLREILSKQTVMRGR